VSVGTPVAFYAPLKSPDHASPSGDRTVSRLLIKALRRAGFAPGLASELRTYEPLGDAALQRELREASLREADRLAESFERLPPRTRPRLWFTYHPYYKAPDWIGPSVAERLAIPYVAAEASRAGKRAGGPWALAHEGAEAAINRADVLFAMTPVDREALERHRPAGQRILDLPPFLDADELGRAPSRHLACSGAPARLLAVGMMRHGDKLESYGLLAQSLRLLQDRAWTLDIVGDGPARAEVEALFRPFGQQVAFRGCIEDAMALSAAYAQADLLVWPAVNEAYGMVLLEAQAMSCPVLAGGYGGVASVMQPGRTGLMPPAGDAEAFALDLAALIADPHRRAAMGQAALLFVRGERNLDGAAAILRAGLSPLIREVVAA
jgi:glycosyltransferase involved in cell wall biosynthesis